jgi:hypothetical protein
MTIKSLSCPFSPEAGKFASGNLYKLWNRPDDVLPIVPKEL